MRSVLIALGVVRTRLGRDTSQAATISTIETANSLIKGIKKACGTYVLHALFLFR